MADKQGHAFDPDWCMRPGVHLREMLDDAGMKGDFGTRQAAKLTGLDVKVIEGILSGKTKITEAIANRLATGTQPLRVSPQMWLNLENTYRAALKAGKADISDDY